jgi:hypothetical protein
MEMNGNFEDFTGEALQSEDLPGIAGGIESNGNCPASLLEGTENVSLLNLESLNS